MAHEPHEFDARIEEATRGGAWVEIPFDAKEAFGSGRLKIKATFDGEPYRGSIACMDGRYVLGVRKSIREAIGKGIGDTVRVTVEADTEPRIAQPPADLKAALQNSALLGTFERLSYTHQREYVEWILEAKRPDTRVRRIQRTLEQLA